MKNIPAILFYLTTFLFVNTALADTIAIIGTGRVASALGPNFAAEGHKIIYGSRDPAAEKVKALVANTAGNSKAMTNLEAAAAGDIIVLAIPYAVALEVVKRLGNLSGKIIIDPTNPYTGRDTGNIDHAMDYQTSAAEQIQELVPGAHVVKAFNTLAAVTMADPKSSGGPVSIPVTGDHERSKNKVMALVESIGLHPVDVGGLHYSNVVEGMLLIRLKALMEGKPFDYYLRPAPQ